MISWITKNASCPFIIFRLKGGKTLSLGIINFCRYHPRKESVEKCTECGAPICENCVNSYIARFPRSFYSERKVCFLCYCDLMRNFALFWLLSVPIGIFAIYFIATYISEWSEVWLPAIAIITLLLLLVVSTWSEVKKRNREKEEFFKTLRVTKTEIIRSID